jgi:hypothetical protein
MTLRDYNLIGDDGTATPVAQVSTQDIQECLQDGFVVSAHDGHLDPERDVRNRLDLELFIRRRGLRR